MTLARVPGGLVTAAADGSPDPFLAAILARYVAEVTADRAHCDAIRAGLIPRDPSPVRWLISDRH